MRFETNIPIFLRGNEIYRRARINHIKKIVEDEPPRRNFTVSEVTEILDRAGIYVSTWTLRSYIKLGVCRAYKKSKKRMAKWWIEKSQIVDMAERMLVISDHYEQVKQMRKYRTRYICHDRPLPDRDERGRFVRADREKKKIEERKVLASDRQHMIPRLQ